MRRAQHSAASLPSFRRAPGRGPHTGYTILRGRTWVTSRWRRGETIPEAIGTVKWLMSNTCCRMLRDGQDTGATESTFFKEVKGAVRLVERKGLHLRANRDVGREPQEVEGILSGAVGDAQQSPLLVEERIVDFRDRGHGDSGDRDSAALPEDPERLKDQPTNRREDDRAVEPARRG